jgi:hypothetical protein
VFGWWGRTVKLKDRERAKHGGCRGEGQKNSPGKARLGWGRQWGCRDAKWAVGNERRRRGREKLPSGVQVPRTPSLGSRSLPAVSPSAGAGARMGVGRPRVEREGGPGRAEREGQIIGTGGRISVDRSSKATLPLTIPRPVFKSSAKDSSPRSSGIAMQSTRARLLPPARGGSRHMLLGAHRRSY